MTFELTDLLASSIMFYMENQTAVFAVDASKGAVVSLEEAGIEAADEDYFYSLPQWTSRDGFELLTAFTDNLHAPLARESLKRVLAGGRGVFRNFKKVIKDFPEVERQWHFFKNKTMGLRINGWYNALRESWGLEKLELPEENETEDLVNSDFIIRPYDYRVDFDGLNSVRLDLEHEFAQNTESPLLGKAVTYLTGKSFSIPAEKRQGFVCCTQDGEITGCALYAYAPDDLHTSVLLTDLFVCENYRGLGIGTELLSQCLDSLRKNGVQWVIFFNIVVTRPLELLLTRYDFKKLGAGYAVKLF
ncbi:GNAT family N-acetyltransferase [Treponema sp.]|uniref:GNAT family N-acetyltransferase n=1 Tax=Treponema sp. TaxID=166 RepID=UPI0025D8963F|nr:GNAT family N-acetyltransferase [Treponema sp.]MCR5217926.1 GNAT family N-acetyltransferase [Treponema sp.]